MTHIYFISGRLETCKDFAPNCDEVIKNEGGCGDEYVQYGCKKSCKLCAEGKEDDNMSDINISHQKLKVFFSFQTFIQV